MPVGRRPLTPYLSTPRTGVLPAATGPAYPASSGQSSRSHPGPQPPPQPLEGYSRGAQPYSSSSSSQPRSGNYSYSQHQSANVDALARDFAHLDTSAGYGVHSQPPPGTSSLAQGIWLSFARAAAHGSIVTDNEPETYEPAACMLGKNSVTLLADTAGLQRQEFETSPPHIIACSREIIL